MGPYSSGLNICTFLIDSNLDLSSSQSSLLGITCKYPCKEHLTRCSLSSLPGRKDVVLPPQLYILQPEIVLACAVQMYPVVFFQQSVCVCVQLKSVSSVPGHCVAAFLARVGSLGIGRNSPQLAQVACNEICSQLLHFKKLIFSLIFYKSCQ